MLPFLKQKPVAGVIVSTRKPDGAGIEEGKMDGDDDAGLMSAAEDLIRAFHAKDAKGVAAAFRAAFDILESEPHDEADHDDNSFDSQNILAAKDSD